MVGNTVKINEKPDLKYPRSVAFIISNEFCERFNFYGMRTILVLYLTRRLGYNDDTATVLYHVFTSLVYFFPLFGAIIADSWLGRFRTILYLSIVYSIGTIIISVGAIPPLELPAKAVTIIGLLFIALGTGGIKPCVSAFGGDQFKIPEQAKQLATFFSLFYFAINAGSLISTSITPILREDVHCFDENDCFSLAFGVPALLMIASIVIFVLGKNLYVIKKPAGNMIVAVTKCIVEALRKKAQQQNSDPKEHWLDYAEPKYGVRLVEDTKALLKILVLYLPLPVFWALFDQQGSRWTFQANRMVGDIGGFTIKPDQMQVINPLLILAFIPLFDYALYPILEKVGIKRPLQKLTLGGLLAAGAFILSGLVEIELEKTYPILPNDGMGQLRIFNGMPCDYEFTTDIPKHKKFTVLSMSSFEEKTFPVMKREYFHYEAFASEPNRSDRCPVLAGEIRIEPERAMSYFIMRDESKAGLLEYVDLPDKPKKGVPMIRVLSNAETNDSLILMQENENASITLDINNNNLVGVQSGSFDLMLGKKLLSSVDLKIGGIYTIIIEGDPQRGYKSSVHTVTQPNSLHMLWQLPQYIVITAGEVMFSVTGLEFSFTQAPSSMKSVLQACWLLTVAVGNLLVVLIAEFQTFESQVAQFFLFAALMIVDMFVFILLAMRYTYLQSSSDSDDNEMSEPSTKRENKSNKHDDVESQKQQQKQQQHPKSSREKSGEENKGYNAEE